MHEPMHEGPARILVLGGGGREHAISWKLASEAGIVEVLVAPGSAGIAAEPGVRVLAVDPLDPGAVVALARAWAVGLVIVGPEAPLSVGVADAVGAAGIAVFGPTKDAARLETSKTFCHDVARAAGVRMARARSFAGGETDAALAFVKELGKAGAGVVLKADGLAAGKGVIVTESTAQALALAPSFLVDRPADGPALVVEERLTGREASVIAICDGSGPWPCPPPVTTSAWATATRARTPVAWAPTRRCRTWTMPAWRRSWRPSTGRSSPRWPGAAPASGDSCMWVSC